MTSNRGGDCRRRSTHLVSSLTVSTFCCRTCLSRHPFQLAFDIIRKRTDGSLRSAHKAFAMAFDIGSIHRSRSH